MAGKNLKGMVFVIWAVMVFILSHTAWCNEIVGGRKIDEHYQPSIKTREGSGYCSQTGGSTKFESIQSTNLELLPDGKTMRLTVGVYIANPDGCVSGSSCPTYDPSPEYVNAWIDWNGNKTFEENEKVMDEAGTGYQNINYSGTMTFVKQFNVPSEHVTDTWMRVSLGWQYDPNNPCESSWTWGNSVDKEVKLEGLPKIKDIKITPDVPVTGKDVIFTADIAEATGFITIGVTWQLDSPTTCSIPAKGVLLKNNESAWSFKPPFGTHGRNTVKATLHYKNTATSEEGTAFFSKEFNLYFEKDGKNENQIPNWFTYWKQDQAVPDIAKAIYDTACVSTTTSKSYGYSSGTDTIALCDASPTNRPKKTYNFNGNKDFYGTDGIDTAAQVIAHELAHQEIAKKWLPNGEWNGAVNSDFTAKGIGDVRDYNDSIPDLYEGTLGTDTNKVDTFNLASQKSDVYKYYGDNEYNSIIKGDQTRGIAEKDWSDSGKIATNAGGTKKKSFRNSDSGSPYHSGRGGSVMMPNSAVFGVSPKILKDQTSLFTNVYSENVKDTNGNGLYDNLTISVGVKIQENGYYSLRGWIYKGGKEVAWASTGIQLNAGSQIIDLVFNGIVLFESKLNGPYLLKRIELASATEDDMFLLAYADDAYTTSVAYNYIDFEHPAVRLGDSYSDKGEDTNGNGKYDSLNISVPVITDIAGQYELSGWLYTSSGQPIGYTEATKQLNAGTTEMVLTFVGKDIRQTRTDGPYTLKQIQLSDQNGTELASNPKGYATTNYLYTDFEGGVADLKSYQDTATDSDNDGYFDVLNIDVTIQVYEAAQYTISGKLVDSNNKLISETNVQLDCTSVIPPASQTAKLTFSGTDIFVKATDGPYYLKDVIIVSGTYGVADHQVDAHTTQSYKYADFKSPLVFATGIYTIKVTDADNDGYFESLTIGITVKSKDAGVVKAEGNLVDSQGNSIAWANNFMQVVAQTPTILELTFDGKDIAKSGKNGPYYLKNLNIYHTGDPSQNFFVQSATSTEAYKSARFAGDESCNAIAIANPTTGYVGMTVSFNAEGSSDGNYEWNFGDNSKKGTGKTTAHTYYQAGIYNVLLTVTTFGGCVATATKAISVQVYPDQGYYEPSSYIVPANQPPTADKLYVSTDQDKPVSVKLSGSDPDVPGMHWFILLIKPITYSVLTQPQHGTLSGTAPDMTYTPEAGYIGTDSFTFKLSDGIADSAPATVSIVINPAGSMYVDDSLALNISCAEYQGVRYGFRLDYSKIADDPFGLYWKMDISTFGNAANVGGSCISVGSDLKINVPSALYKGITYQFSLSYNPMPSDASGHYWKMDLDTFKSR